MNILLINPYDYKTVQSNPGLLSLLHVLKSESIDYAITIVGPVPSQDFNYVAVPESLLDDATNDVQALVAAVNVDLLTHVIAIDPEGSLVAVRFLGAIGRESIRCSYISYEILFAEEILFQREKTLKEHDLAYLRLCTSVLIQDEMRGEMFRREAGLDVSMHFSPVSPHTYLGQSADKEQTKRALGLPLDKKILIYSGSLYPYAKPDWWIEIAEQLPKDFIFLFTCFDGSQFKNHDLARIARILSTKGNALFVQKELPADQYMQVLQACDVGLALFRPVYTHWMNGRNIRQLGLSSGKFSNYICCGLPVICDSNQEYFCKLAVDYPVIKPVTTPEDVSSALLTLQDVGAASADHCKRLFAEVLNPGAGISDFLEALR